MAAQLAERYGDAPPHRCLGNPDRRARRCGGTWSTQAIASQTADSLGRYDRAPAPDDLGRRGGQNYALRGRRDDGLGQQERPHNARPKTWGRIACGAGGLCSPEEEIDRRVAEHEAAVAAK
jgi:hypothetical protein